MSDIVNVDYSTKIPNNVGLTEDRTVLRALEGWHPGYIDWWKTMGPEGFQEALVYLRTAVSVDPKGWAKFDYVKMPDYRWGILLAPQEEGRKIPFGHHLGEPAWQEVPGEYRAMLRRLVVIQGDTEPAPVEQQRHLGKTAPSLYDMRTVFKVNAEEAHHMFVGETGLGRILQRTCEAMKQAGIDDPTEIERVRALGVIDLPTMQKKLNLHYSLSLDLFGSEVSTNAANSFNASLKGRFQETKIEDDHRLEHSTYPVLKLVDGEIKRIDEPALTAINMRLRDDYTADCQRGLDRWNKIIDRTGIAFKPELPHVAFHRQIGEFKDVKASPTGELVDAATWNQQKDKWLPSKDDGDFIQSLMRQVVEPGKFASWIAPPRVG